MKTMRTLTTGWNGRKHLKWFAEPAMDARLAGSIVDSTAMNVSIRPARTSDLDAINHVIEAAVMTWNLPERVKRLSLPGYRYTPLDLEHFEFAVAEDTKKNIIGVTAWEQASANDTPAGKTALLLHGIYVAPAYHRQGVGQALFRQAEAAARQQGFDGILVRAQEDACGFFITLGMHRLAVEDHSRHYVNRFWKTV
jgi:predicted N-acetyltransferase YhbS